jgi:hypothetical protein
MRQHEQIVQKAMSDNGVGDAGEVLLALLGVLRDSYVGVVGGRGPVANEHARRLAVTLLDVVGQVVHTQAALARQAVEARKLGGYPEAGSIQRRASAAKALADMLDRAVGVWNVEIDNRDDIVTQHGKARRQGRRPQSPDEPTR